MHFGSQVVVNVKKLIEAIDKYIEQEKVQVKIRSTSKHFWSPNFVLEVA
jgi:hypothetical protein